MLTSDLGLGMNARDGWGWGGAEAQSPPEPHGDSPSPASQGILSALPGASAFEPVSPLHPAPQPILYT